MTLTKEEKEAAIAAARGPLEHELFAAETDLEVAEAGDSEELVAGPKARVEEIKAKLKVLDDKKKKL